MPALTLAPFADLAGFCGVRAPLEARLADPAAPVPPHTGEYRAALETLTDLTRTAVVGPPAPVFARGSMVVDFFRNRPWPPALAGWPAAYPDSLLDVRDRARFFDGSNDARADLLRERFPRVLRPLVTLPRVVDGSPPFEQHDYALTLMRVYTPEALPRLLASFQTLDATLARAWAQITSPAATAAGRVQQLISQRQILDEEDRRPGASLPSPAIVVAGGGGAKGASAPSSWSAPVSYARASACFVDASRTALRRWLDSPIVCAPLAYHNTVANATPSIDERRSGLLELLRHHAYCDAQEALRVALDKQALPVIQFLVCRDIEHPHELFARLSNVRHSFVKHISESMLASDAGVLDGKDLDFKLGAAVVDKFILGRWSEIHFFNDIHVMVSRHRSGSTSVRNNGTKRPAASGPTALTCAARSPRRGPHLLDRVHAERAPVRRALDHHDDRRLPRHRARARPRLHRDVSFSSVPCQASTVPFPMTPPYVGGASSSFFLSPFSLTLVATHLARPHRA